MAKGGCGKFGCGNFYNREQLFGWREQISPLTWMSGQIGNGLANVDITNFGYTLVPKIGTPAGFNNHWVMTNEVFGSTGPIGSVFNVKFKLNDFEEIIGVRSINYDNAPFEYDAPHHAIRYYGNNNYIIYEFGATVFVTNPGTGNVNNVMEIDSDGTTVRYKINDTTIYTSLLTPNIGKYRLNYAAYDYTVQHLTTIISAT